MLPYYVHIHYNAVGNDYGDKVLPAWACTANTLRLKSFNGRKSHAQKAIYALQKRSSEPGKQKKGQD